MENTQNPESVWSLPKKIAFRFFFIFFLLFIIIQNNGAYALWGFFMKYPTELLHLYIPWFAKHVLHLPFEITVFTNGSGDTTYDYVIVLNILLAAVLGTAIWTVLDRQRRDYSKLYYWLTVAVRFYVGLMLINYGLVKVVKLQFPYPGFYRLTQNFGDASPMGLAWTFLGFSKGYNLFMGLAEVSAVLLLFRRTMTFGALITLGTTVNVMAVNYFYDVPVKILSTALVAMTLFLLARDAGRLFNFFFTGEKVALPVIRPPEFKKRWLRIAKVTLKVLVIGYALLYGLYQVNEFSHMYGENVAKPKLYGLYLVDSFVVNGDTLPPLKTDDSYWTELHIEREGYASVRYMNDQLGRYTISMDTLDHRLDLMQRDSIVKGSFHYDIPEPERLLLAGTIEQDSVSVFMTRKTEADFQLINRGFHWVNQYPFNR